MSENILIAIAWPYANAEIHVGNITGSHLPGDITARFHRLRGNKVLMVSGTDSHGTPVTIAAERPLAVPKGQYRQVARVGHRRGHVSSVLPGSPGRRNLSPGRTR